MNSLNFLVKQIKETSRFFIFIFFKVTMRIHMAGAVGKVPAPSSQKS